MYIVKREDNGDVIAYCSKKEDAEVIRDSEKVDKITYIVEELKVDNDED
jgi:hypothetical protein